MLLLLAREFPGPCTNNLRDQTGYLGIEQPRDPLFRIDHVNTRTPIRYPSPKAAGMILAGAGELNY